MATDSCEKSNYRAAPVAPRGGGSRKQHLASLGPVRIDESPSRYMRTEPDWRTNRDAALVRVIREKTEATRTRVRGRFKRERRHWDLGLVSDERIDLFRETSWHSYKVAHDVRLIDESSHFEGLGRQSRGARAPRTRYTRSGSGRGPAESGSIDDVHCTREPTTQQFSHRRTRPLTQSVH